MSEAAQSATSAPAVLESRAGAVVTLTLNRPERLNVLNVELAVALRAALQRAAADSDVRVVVLTGAGRAFSAGGDIQLLRETRARNAMHELGGLLRAGREIVLALADMEKPTLACVNGPAAGGG